MFTGIIKYTLPFKVDGSIITLLGVPSEIFDNIEIGSSISVNGVCLTVIRMTEDTVKFFIMEETFEKTTLSTLKSGKSGKANVELSLKNNSSVDGHYVTGHVDTCGKITDIDYNGDGSTNVWIKYDMEKFTPKYKDSISIDGVSLTIAEVKENRLRVSIIPYTKCNTIIQYYSVGMYVNIEFNKYITMIKDDNYWMREAIKEGEKGRLKAHPNPWVGCVIVDPETNRCISRGHHRGPGTPHAEVDALESLESIELAKGSHIYTTLEPCHFYEGEDELLKARTGCDMRLIDAKVGRVIIGMLDADLRVINTGINELINAGIEVDIIDDDVAGEVKDSFKEYIESRNKLNPTYDSLDSALEDLKDGKFIIVADEDNRENEYDLVSVASTCTVESMNFFLNYTTGKHCVVLSPERASHIGIKNMVPREENKGAQQTPFGMPIDSKYCKTTGVDAEDRCISVLTLANGNSDDYTLAGHTDTLISHPGGILARRGHTEASITLARLLDIKPINQAMLIGELMIRDLSNQNCGKMMREKESSKLAKEYGLKMIHVSQLLDNLKPLVTTKIPLDEHKKDWNVSLYACKESPNYYHRVCVYGLDNSINNHDDKEVLVRIHSECWTGDCLGSALCDCGKQLAKAKKQIIEAGYGVIIFPANHEGRGIGLVNKLRAYNIQRNQGLNTYEANEKLGFDKDLRSYDDIPYLLRSLGITNVKLLTANPDKIKILQEKLNKVSHVTLDVVNSSPHVKKYLEDKHSHFENVRNGYDSSNNTLFKISEYYEEECIEYTNGYYRPYNILFAISEYYEEQCRQLMGRVRREITVQHPTNFDLVVAPGTREIPWFVNQKLKNNKYDAVFAIGITMKGDTNHHDIIATSCTTGLMNLEIKYDIPIPTAIIAAPNMEVVKERTQGNKCTAKSLASTILKSIKLNKT